MDVLGVEVEPPVAETPALVDVLGVFAPLEPALSASSGVVCVIRIGAHCAHGQRDLLLRAER